MPLLEDSLLSQSSILFVITSLHLFQSNVLASRKFGPLNISFHRCLFSIKPIPPIIIWPWLLFTNGDSLQLTLYQRFCVIHYELYYQDCKRQMLIHHCASFCKFFATSPFFEILFIIWIKKWQLELLGHRPQWSYLSLIWLSTWWKIIVSDG